MLVERSHASIKQAFRGKQVSKDHCGTNTSVLRSLITTVHTTKALAVSQAELLVLLGCNFFKDLNIKVANRPEQAPILTSRIAQDVFHQRQMINQDVRKNSIRVHITAKAYYNNRANSSKLKEADYVQVLQLIADHQGNKIFPTEFWWKCPYFSENVLPNSNYLVRKIGTNKTQVLHRIRMCQFIPQQPLL